MNCNRTITATALSKQSATHMLKTLNGKATTTAARPAFILLQSRRSTTQRQFSTSRPTLMKELFPPPDTPNIKTTEAAWQHPIYSYEQMESIKVAHREARTVSDHVALSIMRTVRFGMDLVTGYKHDKAVANGTKDPKDAKSTSSMTERKWMIRFIFLETVAGVPGMVAGMLRHLHSLRRMKRDNGWIETCLEESYNERMHLLTFLQVAQPGWFMRLVVLGAQGVFFNTFFISYLISPRTAHRFVGYLEEEAVLTYTRVLQDIDAGKLPKFAQMQAPEIAVKYWNMPEGQRTMRDAILYIRADEAKHREVNHTLGNLDQKNDPNPYAAKFEDESRPHPVKDIKFHKATGWEREEAL
ncbi:inducible alternative oxidase 2 [Friedmanniomyces endolithicus]|uniref:Alternative oxidase n=1 Tax=Friedmanniomyces endolithicus TaxID=329885 RepID=A0AAN6FR51_9PEZI|nr:inducible alternative oxidase 2 [Friedmanniomyces endolithicus]KAK0301261.1 inducible alternative oxidase 2 [Friedmanniomyces endolithicus]KAK0322178.1 inducible alternative oxidase 2 [Friedmanniomyces endolithicus]KAK1014553.1 inducible alternative oxidase 2 [Friedmanniomyces endolithicus]